MNHSSRIIFLVSSIIAGCSMPQPPTPLVRKGHEIAIAGEFFDIGTKVILWNDPGGLSGYDHSNFAERDSVTQAPWDLKRVREAIDQFVIHYDGSGSSADCFRVLNDRGLSVHFMLDTDGTIYQMLDVKERAWHATKANSRSVGVEIANVGAFPVDQSERLEQWYQSHSVEPMLQEAVVGEIQGQKLRMYDLTARQYEALIKLTAGLCRALPRIACTYPRSNAILTDSEFEAFHGVLGHYHIQLDKIDPGPAFQWDRVIDGARAILRTKSTN